MTRFVGLVLALFAITLLVVNSGCNQGAAHQPQTGQPSSSSESSADETEAKARSPFKNDYSAEDIERMRKEHPYVSLADRLAYEPPREDRTEPNLSEQADERLTLREVQYAPPNENLRAKSLALMHSEEVEKFIAREGTGLERIRPPGPSYIELAPLEPIPLAQVPASAGDAPWTSASPPVAEASLLAFHDQGEVYFASPHRNGHVRDRDHVAGFGAHGIGDTLQLENLGSLTAAQKSAFEFSGDPNGELKKERWEITRMELVSLLKFDRPAVYVSKMLPRMEELRDAETRPLTEFEAGGLERLRGGEDLATHSTLNRIQMFGSLRATNQCLQCHDAHRGELLGAFSYELLRVPQRTPSTSADPAAD
jgi:hypothetical protein